MTEAIVNTALGTSAAGVSTLLAYKLRKTSGGGAYYSFLTTMNGSLTGKKERKLGSREDRAFELDFVLSRKRNTNKDETTKAN